MRPRYRGDRCRFLEIIDAVSEVVRVIQHGNCSTWNKPSASKFRVNTSSGVFRTEVEDNRGGGSSPSCRSTIPKSIVLPLIRHGVPVLNRADSKSKDRKLSLNVEDASAIRPPGLDCSPTCKRP